MDDNLLWSVNSKIFRDFYRESYRNDRDSDFNEGFNFALETVFGIENLISDEEPEEVFVIPRKKILEVIKDFEKSGKGNIAHSVCYRLVGPRCDADEEINSYKEEFEKDFESKLGVKPNPLWFSQYEKK